MVINVTIGVSSSYLSSLVDPNRTAISPKAVNATETILTAETMQRWSSGEYDHIMLDKRVLAVQYLYGFSKIQMNNLNC